MNPELVPVLADLLKTYFDRNDLFGLWKAFDLEPLWDNPRDIPDWMGTARDLITQSNVGNRGRLLTAVLSTLEDRVRAAHHSTKVWEERQYLEGIFGRIEALKKAAQEDGIPEEMTVAEAKPFTAKSRAREFFAAAETEITLVDNYVGPATLDCVREVKQRLRILTGSHSQTAGDDFKRALKDMRKEGFDVKVKQHPKLHDRYVLFNDRCWLAGSSLKDAGTKAFNVNELVDSKDSIRQDVEKKWSEAADLPE